MDDFDALRASYINPSDKMQKYKKLTFYDIKKKCKYELILTVGLLENKEICEKIILPRTQTE